MIEYRIPAINFPCLQEEIAVLQKRAKKLGLVEPTLVADGQEIVKKKNRLGFETEEIYYLCRVEGESPKLNGWSLLGVIEPQPSGENLLRMVPGNHCPEQYRTTTMFCDHCKTERKRNKVCILQHEDGRTVQVGRNCLKDFLGHASPESLLKAAELLWSFDGLFREAGEEGWGGKKYLNSETFLATVVIVMRRFGWVPRSKADEGNQATADLAWAVQTDPSQAMSDFIRKNNLHAEEKEGELAKKTLEWASSIDAKVGNDYLYNLGVVARMGIVDHKTCGILASAISSYQREVEKQLIANKPSKVHLGTVGKREVFENITINSIRPFEGSYGTTYLVRMADSSGNVIIWWASVDPEDLGLEVGNTFKVKATVKEHSEFQCQPQTEVQRLVIVEN